jgi:hypothetical protein
MNRQNSRFFEKIDFFIFLKKQPVFLQIWPKIRIKDKKFVAKFKLSSYLFGNANTFLRSALEKLMFC